MRNILDILIQKVIHILKTDFYFFDDPDPDLDKDN